MESGLGYKSTIKSRPFLFKETKNAAMLKIEGFNELEIKEKAKNENIFQVNTETRRSEIASIVLQRLKVLDEYLIEKLANGDIDTSKQIAIYAIEKTDRLFFEFIPSGCSSQLHYHPHAEETYYILKGSGKMIVDDKEFLVKPGDTIFIAPPERHLIFANGNEDLEFAAICAPAWEPTNSVFLD